MKEVYLERITINKEKETVTLHYSDGDVFDVKYEDYARALMTLINGGKEEIKKDFAINAKPSITLILKRCNGSYPVAYAENEKEAKRMIMDKLENHPEWYNNDEELWWEKTSWNVKEVYTLKTIYNSID